jgi:hypothetical protein
MCGQFCAAMYGYGASGYVDALTQWEMTPSTFKRPGSLDPAPGALVFWGGGSAGHGHVAIAVGDGSCWSIDIAGAGTVSRAPITAIHAQWGLPYLGWAAPYFQGQAWEAKMIKGVDVSNYQAVSGWETGADFAFVKITEGTAYVNPKWVAQRDTARRAGLVVGYYHFARPGNMVAQADYFLSQVTLQPGDVLAFDWEDSGVTSAQKDAWIAYVQGKTGHRVVLYCNTSFWKTRDTSSFAGDGLWIATGGIPSGAPPIQSPWLIHQYSTAGNLDHNVAQFDSRDAMRTWAQGDDVALTTDDKAWITKLLTDKAYSATLGKDAVRSPDDAASNPTWAAGSYLREGYLRLLEIKAQAAANGTTLSQILLILQGMEADPASAASRLRAVLENITMTIDVKE